MQLGVVGLGRMGANIVRRLLRAGCECIVFDRTRSAMEAVEASGARAAESLAALVESLAPPRSIWLMVPAGAVEALVTELSPLLARDDTILDGGNSHFQDDIRRAGALAEQGIHHIDVGTSGGVWGLERGYCLMIGGESEPIRRLEPVFTALSPGADAAPPRHRGWARRLAPPARASSTADPVAPVTS